MEPITATAAIKWLLSAFGISAVDMFVDKSTDAFLKNKEEIPLTNATGSIESSGAKRTKDELFMIIALTAACLEKEASRLGFKRAGALTPTERKLFESIIMEARPMQLERISHLIGNTAERISSETDVVIRNDLGAIIILGINQSARGGLGPDVLAQAHPEAFRESIRKSLKAGGAYNTTDKKIEQGISQFFEKSCQALNAIPSTTADRANLKQKIEDVKKRNSRI